MVKKIDKLTELLCQWNLRKWKGKENKLLHEIWMLFNTECLVKWNKKLSAIDGMCAVIIKKEKSNV